MTVVQMAVPLFFILITIELVVSLARGRGFYRLNDSIADLSTSAIFSIAGIAITIAWVAVYECFGSTVSVQALFALPAVPAGSPLRVGSDFLNFSGWSLDGTALLAWTLALLGVDFLYYWFHRATHQVNFLWACHVTHHSSEEFNLTVALRQCAFQRAFEYAFMLPLAALGIPWFMMLICHEIMKLYQFWVHTRFFGKLGFMEKFLLTPSHHRVHHGRDPEYLDKNHGGILILWDKWFGTFAEEQAEPHYGLTKPLTSFNPLWTNVHHYVYLGQQLGKIHRWSDKLRFLLKPPGWKPAELGRVTPTQPVPANYKPYNPELPRTLNVYAFVQFLVLMGTTLLILRLARAPESAALPLFLLGGLVVGGFGSIGAILDRHPRALAFEFLRLGVSVPFFFLLIHLEGGLPAYPGFLFMALGAASLGWLLALRERFPSPAVA